MSRAQLQPVVFGTTEYEGLLSPTIPVDISNDEEMAEVAQLVYDMMEYIKDIRAIGLAANQIGVNKSVLVYSVGGVVGALINPSLQAVGTHNWEAKEGCLSLPGIFLDMERPWSIEVSATAVSGKDIQFLTNGWASRVIQHEVDHLNGILMIQRWLDANKVVKLQELKELAE